MKCIYDMYVRACAAHQTNTDRIDRPARAKTEKKEEANGGELRSLLRSPPSSSHGAEEEGGFFMHAGHPSITWGENSPPATVPCVPCAPGSRESVSSHRYAHPHTQQTHTVSVCQVRLSVVCCSSGPSIRLAARARSPNKNTRYFWRHSSLALSFVFCFGHLLSPSSPLGPSDEALVTRSSCTHRGGLTPPPSNPPGPSACCPGPFGCYGPIQGRLMLGGRASVTVAYGLT